MSLTIIIPARNEEWLQDTIDDILEHSKAKILVGLDGWETEIKENERVKVIYEEKSIGQRAMQNKLARLVDTPYLMKVDAHCSFSDNFDAEMLKDITEDMVLVPILFNLHAYDWVCDCGRREYQGLEPAPCHHWKKEKVWRIKPKPFFSNFVFDKDLIFQFAEKQSNEILSETMSIQGSGFMVSKDTYFKFNLCDEQFGSWGMQGSEVAIKTWLQGGRVISTKNAFMGHLFRKHEEFPYQRDMEQVDHALEYAKDIFYNNKIPNRIHDLKWLVEKFDYPYDWKQYKLSTGT